MAQDLQRLSDEALVEIIRSYDQELFTEIVSRYQNKLLRYVNYLVQEKEKSADVVQEAFIKAFINLYGFKTNKKFSSWLYRIAHNEAINYLKKYSREIPLDPEDLSWPMKKTNHLNQDYEQAETRQMLQSCMAKLPVIYRDPLTLYFFEEKSYQEISDILRIPLGTLSTRINRGKKIMKDLCAENKIYG